jgi:hypothetical protein
MIAPKALADAIVTKLRLCAALVTELGGDSAHIAAYEDRFPASSSLSKAVQQMGDRHLLVVWNGTAKGSAQGRTVWLHRFSLVVKGVAFSAAWDAVANSVLTGGSQNLRYVEIYPPYCYPLFADISAERKTLYVDEYTTLDYLEMPLTLTERGSS